MELARAVLGVTQTTFIPALPTGVTPTIAGPDPVMSIGNSCQLSVVSSQLDMVQVPVNLSYSAGLASVDLALSYDTAGWK